jgi:hypothetical protein
MWKSWSVYASIGFVVISPLGLLWAFRRDRKDRLNYDKVRHLKHRLFVGLFLEPYVFAKKDVKKKTTMEEYE